MRDVYYQAVGNPLQNDRLPLTRPVLALLARPVPFTAGLGQIAATGIMATLAGVLVLAGYRPPGWTWLEPFDLLFAAPVLLAGVGAALMRNQSQWLIHPAVLTAAALWALNHRTPWLCLVLLAAGSAGGLAAAVGWHWAVLCTAAPFPHALAVELRDRWRKQLMVIAALASLMTAALLWFDIVWLKLAVLALPVAALATAPPTGTRTSRVRMVWESLYSWLTYDAPDRPGLLPHPLASSVSRSAILVFAAVLAAAILIRWDGSPLPLVRELGAQRQQAVATELAAQEASVFTQHKFGSVPAGVTAAVIVLMPVVLPWILAISFAAPVLWEATAWRDWALPPQEDGDEHVPLPDLRHSLDFIERHSVSLGRVVADGSPVLVPRKVYSEHAHGLGDSGSGKTSLFLCPTIEQLAARGDCSLIVIDLKADSLELLATLQAVVERVEHEQRHTLPLKFFSNQADKATFAFNPMTQPFWKDLDLLTRTEILRGANGLTYGTDYGQGYYSSANTAILHHALKTFPHTATFEELAEGIAEVVITAPKRELHLEIRKAGVHVHEVMKRLASCAPLNVTAATGQPRTVVEQQIDLTQVFREPQLMYFHLSATLSPSGAPEIARLVNYMLLAAATQTERKVPVFLVIDEFQRMVAANLEYMLQLARSMGVGVILANQSIEDLRKSTTNLIPAIEANCRLRQWFAVSCSDDQQRLIAGSGTAIDYALGESVTTRSDGEKSVSRSRHEQVVPRITLNDILLMNDHPFRSVLHLKRSAGYAQYGGMPTIIESAFHISTEEYRRRKEFTWPKHEGAFVPADFRDDGELGGRVQKSGPWGLKPAGPVWSEEQIEPSQSISPQNQQSIDDLFAEFQKTLPPPPPQSPEESAGRGRS